MNKINKVQAFDMIKNSNGKIFTVSFFKKNGELRKMNCRLGVTKHLKGGELKYNPLAKSLIPVFDMQKQDYRMISLETLQTLTINGKQHYVFGEK